MGHAIHDTFVDAARGTPAAFLWSARALPAALALQFLLAGHALFAGLPWDLHAAVGALVGAPVLTLGVGAAVVARLRGFRWWCGIVGLLYLLQVSLGAYGGGMLAYHPFNAALLLSASLVVLAKVERRRAHRP